MGEGGSLEGRRMKWVFFFCLSAAALAAPFRSLDGVFVRLEQGDYQHVVIRDAGGRERSFFVQDDGSFARLLEKPAAFRGKRLRLRWHHVTRALPEAGGPVPLDEATSMKVLR